MKDKIEFLLRSVSRRLFSAGSLLCPSCGGEAATILDRKRVVLSFARCAKCLLCFRQPTTPPKQSVEFYQDTYAQGYGTDMPDDATLQDLMVRGFAGTERDYARFVAMFDALGVPRDAKIMDFGCSWGYGAWQLAKAGYEVEAYEVSRPRCHYAKSKLGVAAHDSLDALGRKFDVVFSSHVLEHVDILSESLGFMESRLKPGGLMVHLTPNGSQAYREFSPRKWHLAWGEVHAQLLDERFCLARYRNVPLLLGATPSDLNELRTWDRKETKLLDLRGPELFFVTASGRDVDQGR